MAESPQPEGRTRVHPSPAWGVQGQGQRPGLGWHPLSLGAQTWPAGGVGKAAPSARRTEGPFQLLGSAPHAECRAGALGFPRRCS